MTRTIVDIFLDNHQVKFNLQCALSEFTNARDLHDLECTEDDIPFINIRKGSLGAEVVRSAGTHLFETLAKHPAVKDAITVAMASPQHSVAPIYIHLNCAQAEGLPWETLYAPTGDFLALDSRWPIARVVDSPVVVPIIYRTFRPPLKIIAVLSAVGVDAVPQWRVLYEIAKNASTEIELLVFVCQQELKTAIEALGEPCMKVQYLSNKPDFFAAVKRFGPHILHFFCHGSTEGGAHLELAARDDWEGEKPHGSIAIEPNELYQFVGSSAESNIWLVVLNCCESAAADARDDDAYSFARSLVAKGFPAAIGMRENIASDDAHTFCQALYPALLAILEEVGQYREADKDFIEVEWARALHRPRIQLCDKHAGGQPFSIAAATCKEWTLPIIYVRSEVFMLRTRTINPDLSLYERETLQATLNTLREQRAFIATLPAITQSILAEVDNHIAKLEEKLYPQYSRRNAWV